MRKINAFFWCPTRCPTCGPHGHKVSQIVNGRMRTPNEVEGFRQGRLTKMERMKTYCTAEAHAKRAFEMKYCNLCHRRISR